MPQNQTPDPAAQTQRPRKVFPKEQEPEDVLRFDTDLVSVDVTAIDAEGRPVRNLRQEDFKLFSDGRRTANLVLPNRETTGRISSTRDRFRTRRFRQHDIRRDRAASRRAAVVFKSSGEPSGVLCSHDVSGCE